MKKVLHKFQTKYIKTMRWIQKIDLLLNFFREIFNIEKNT